MEWTIAFAEHKCGREEQQDHVMIFDSESNYLLVLADGMGGHKGGSTASKLVVETAAKAWQETQAGATIKNPRHFLVGICEEAHHEIFKFGQEKNISPRSTCILLYIKDNYAWWVHAGDSRLYHFSRKKLLFRTRDHSVVQMLFDLGRIKEEEIATHPDQGRLLKGLGDEQPLEPELGESQLNAGDSFLLCSDGLWEQISPKEMLSALTADKFSLQKIAKSLVKRACDKSDRKGDNISIGLIKSKPHWLQTLLQF